MRLPTYDGEKPYIFISYAHKDAEVVLPVLDGMQKNGFRIWFDQGIEAGTEWPEYIAGHLEAAERVIVFMSEAAAASKNCRREINYSIEIDKEPLVVYLEPVNLPAGLKLQLNTLQAMFKYHAETEEDFITEICKAKMLQCCREAEEPAPTPAPTPVPAPAPTPTPTPTPAPQEVGVSETPDAPEPPKATETPEPPKAPAPVEEPIPAPMPPEGFGSDKPKKKFKLGKKAIIAICCIAVFIIGFAAIAIGYLSNLEEEPITTELIADMGNGTTCEVKLYHLKSNNIINKIEMTVRYDISDYEYNASELKDQLNELRTELREEVKDYLFASTFVGTEPNTIYTQYRFEYLDKNDYAQKLVDDFFETKEYSPHYDEGDYRMYYVTMLAALRDEGFTLVKN